jgi:Sel1 repeat-containing protein
VVGPNQVRTLIHSKLVLGGGSLCALLVVLFATTGSAAARADNGRPTATMVAFEQAADGQATDGKDTRSAREKRRRPTEAEFEELTAAAQGGDAKAQYNLGMLYHNGGGKAHPRDYEQAMKWLRMAADQGHVEAEDRVGLMYYLGEGVPQDYLEAVRWYKTAANKGNAHAQWQLVDMYQKGIGVPQDLEESKRWARLGQRPDHGVLRARLWFGGAVLATLAFALGLFALQFHKLSGWQFFCVAVFVHAVGTFLVINSLITYGFWIVVPNCKFGFLAPSCTQFTDPHTRSIANWFANYAIVNLIFRFMLIFGLGMDLLAGWYLVYLARLVFWRGRRTAATPVVLRATS